MTQFAAHRNLDPISLGRFPYLLDVQHDLLSILGTRLVMPIVLEERLNSKTIFTLMPVLLIEGKRHVVMATQLTSVPIERMGPVAVDFTADRHAILDALEMLVHGL